ACGGYSGGARAGGGYSGGARAGGGYSGGASFNRSPSMSRAAPSQGMNRPSQLPSANRPSQRPSTGYGQGNAGNRPSQLPATRPGTGGTRPGGRDLASGVASRDRPSQGQLRDFLDMPADSSRRGTASSLASPSQLPSNTRGGRQTATGPGGGELTVGGVGGARTGPGGGTVAAGRVGASYTGPGGNTYTKVAGGAAIRGPGGNTVAAGRGAAFANGQFVGGRSWTAVNGNFTRWNSFTPGWYGGYPGAWWPGKWAVAGTAWTAAYWATAGAYCGCTGEGVYYDYADNVKYDNGIVYYGDEPVASAEQYYTQADQIADSGAKPQNQEWLPLGVFAVISEPTQTQSDKTVELAINKEGVIRGNLHDALTDKLVTISGAVDKQTQRAAMKVEGTDVVVETGLYNLTNDEVPVLVFFGSSGHQARTLIRLQQPEEQGKPS
ncbi:MAG: protocadherin, partial [Thermoguttaceae bacterium]